MIKHILRKVIALKFDAKEGVNFLIKLRSEVAIQTFQSNCY